MQVGGLFDPLNLVACETISFMPHAQPIASTGAGTDLACSRRSGPRKMEDVAKKNAFS